MDRSHDEVFLAGQDAGGQHRDAQGRLFNCQSVTVNKKCLMHLEQNN